MGVEDAQERPEPAIHRGEHGGLHLSLCSQPFGFARVGVVRARPVSPVDPSALKLGPPAVIPRRRAFPFQGALILLAPTKSDKLGAGSLV
jgi:hypothetical protein